MLEHSYKYYIIYQTTCKINGKIYIGQHQTDILNDNYLGSGKILNEDIRKFGRENFERQILFTFDNFEDMNNKEKELVTSDFVSRDDTYNLIVGGQVNNYESRRLGGINAVKKEKLLGICTSPYKILPPEKIRAMKQKQAETRKRRIAEGKIKPSFLGKHHTEETKQKMSEIFQRNHHQQGSKNSCYGKHWWMNPETGESKSFYETEQIPNGWIRGRKCNFSEAGLSSLRKRGLPAKQHTTIKNYRWINNGKVNKMLPSFKTLPEGWNYGMIKKVDKMPNNMV